MYYDRLVSHPAMATLPPGKQRHFAIAKIGKTTYLGWNNRKGRPQIQYRKQNGIIVNNYHAETHVLYKIPKYKRHKASFYVTRISKCGNMTYSKPCAHCIFTLLEHGVKLGNIWYTDYASNWIQMTHKDLGDQNVKRTSRYIVENTASIKH